MTRSTPKRAKTSDDSTIETYTHIISIPQTSEQSVSEQNKDPPQLSSEEFQSPKIAENDENIIANSSPRTEGRGKKRPIEEMTPESKSGFKVKFNPFKKEVDSKALLVSPSTLLKQVKQNKKCGKYEDVRALVNTVLCTRSTDTNSREDAIKLLNELLENGIDPNVEEDHWLMNVYGGSPLHIAVEHNLFQAAQILLKHGASMTVKYKQVSPLMMAFQRRNLRIFNAMHHRIENLQNKANADESVLE
mmetsp:Transcript_896/g.1347  ORF Transcript_896/g.1347 Transcript_896/m.1347 type:complete len:247 (-) Transcript_896:38-778(-)